MSAVRVDVDGGVASLCWDRHQVRNAMDSATASALTAELAELQGRDDIGAILLQPAPGAFCAGWDLKELEAVALRPREEIAAFLEGNLALMDAVAVVPQMTVAVVDGACLGFGAALAAGCDLRLATDRTRFGFPEAPLGVVPAIAALAVVAVTTRGRAVTWLATGQIRSAAAAQQAGLLDEVIPAGELSATVAALREHLGRVPPEILRGTKQLVAQLADVDRATARRRAIETAVASLQGASSTTNGR